MPGRPAISFTGESVRKHAMAGTIRVQVPGLPRALEFDFNISNELGEGPEALKAQAVGEFGRLLRACAEACEDYAEDHG